MGGRIPSTTYFSGTGCSPFLPLELAEEGEGGEDTWGGWRRDIGEALVSEER